jgi:hypothetical protein
MILYHFTSFYNLKNVGPENILAVGLKPGKDSWREWPLEPVPPPVVWFTTNPNPTVRYAGYWEARITAMIPSHDRKLIGFAAYLRKHYTEGLEFLQGHGPIMQEGLRDFYLYFGHVPVSRFRAVDPVETEAEPEGLATENPRQRMEPIVP